MSPDLDLNDTVETDSGFGGPSEFVSRLLGDDGRAAELKGQIDLVCSACLDRWALPPVGGARAAGGCGGTRANWRTRTSILDLA